MATAEIINNGHGVTGQLYSHLRVTFYTEDGEKIVNGRDSNQQAALDGTIMESNLLAFQSKNDNNDDMPSFSLILTGGNGYNKIENWEDIIKPNDYVKVDVIYFNDQVPVSGSGDNVGEVFDKEVTLIAGLVSDININSQFSQNQDAYTITCQGVAKILDNIQLSTFSELVTNLSSYMLLPDDENQGIQFQGNNARNIITQILERFLFNKNDYTSYNFLKDNGQSFANGQSIINKFNYDASKPTEEQAGNFDEKMYSMPQKYMNYNGSLLSLIKDLANKPFNELYWTHEEGIATLHHRFTPFDPDRWNKLDIIHVDNSTIQTINVDNTDTEQYAIFKMTSDSSSVTTSTLSSFLYPLTNTSLIKMWGYKMMDIGNDYFNPIVATTDSDSDSSGGTGSGDISGSSNAQKAWNFFTSIGYSKKATAAILGNMSVESTFNPAVVSSSGYHGLSQWDNKNRWPVLVAWAKKKGLSATSMEAQLKYIQKELNGAYSKAKNYLMQSEHSINEYTEYYTRYYEGAVNSDGTLQALAKRQTEANKAYNQFKNSEGKKDNTSSKKSKTTKKSLEYIEKAKVSIKGSSTTPKNETKTSTKTNTKDSKANTKDKDKKVDTSKSNIEDDTTNVSTNHKTPSYDYVNAILTASANSEKVDDKTFSSEYGGEALYMSTAYALKQNYGGDVKTTAQTIMELAKGQNKNASLSNAETLVNTYTANNGKMTPTLYRQYMFPMQEYYSKGGMPTLTSPMNKWEQAKKHPYKDAKLLMTYTNNNLGSEQAFQIIQKWIKNKGKLSSAEYAQIIKDTPYAKENAKLKSSSASSNTAYDLIIKYTRKLFNWYADNSKYYSGTITIMGSVGIEIGKRLQFKDEKTNKLWDFYVEDIEHNYTFDEGWTTTVGVTRGLKLDNDKDNKRFEMMFGQYTEFLGGYFGEPTLLNSIDTAKAADSSSDDSDSDSDSDTDTDDVSADVSNIDNKVIKKAVELAIKLSQKSTFYNKGNHADDPFKAGRRGSDCSGSVYWVYEHAGYNWKKHNIDPVNSSTRQLDKSWATNLVTPIGTSQAEMKKKIKVGDLVFYTFSGIVNGHVALYIGDGKIMSCDEGGYGLPAGVKIEKLFNGFLQKGMTGHIRRLK